LKHDPSVSAPEFDFSELRGLTYRCLDGCALCCLCQPELLPEEKPLFLSDPELKKAVSDRHISPDVRGAALRLHGSHGACILLKNRRCTNYDRRPHYCRAFPVSIFLGWRVQLNANLSCRGLFQDGESLERLGEEIIGQMGPQRISKERISSARVFEQFKHNLRDTRTAQSFESVREVAAVLGEDMTDRLGLSRILTYASHGRTRPNSKAAEIAKRARTVNPDADIDELGVALGTELFDLTDLSYLPVYVDENLDWTIFRLEGREIIGYRLEEDGAIEELSRTKPDDIELVPMTSEGRKALREYLALTNRRDCFLGHAAYLSDMDGYEHNFGQVYLGTLAETAVDLWWRASFLARLSGGGDLDCRAVRDGAVFLDMDVLDQPTIGAFL